MDKSGVCKGRGLWEPRSPSLPLASSPDKLQRGGERALEEEELRQLCRGGQELRGLVPPAPTLLLLLLQQGHRPGCGSPPPPVLLLLPPPPLLLLLLGTHRQPLRSVVSSDLPSTVGPSLLLVSPTIFLRGSAAPSPGRHTQLSSNTPPPIQPILRESPSSLNSLLRVSGVLRDLYPTSVQLSVDPLGFPRPPPLFFSSSRALQLWTRLPKPLQVTSGELPDISQPLKKEASPIHHFHYPVYSVLTGGPSPPLASPELLQLVGNILQASLGSASHSRDTF
nr:uncharacterized protein LOC107400159 [Peromyscus maniculatus bairdii]